MICECGGNLDCRKCNPIISRITMDDVQLLITAVNESSIPPHLKWSLRSGLDKLQAELQTTNNLYIVRDV